MKSNLVKNTTIYTIGSILPKIGSFIFLPLYASYLSTSEFGIISSLHILDAILSILFTLSFPRALYRVYYDYKGGREHSILNGTLLISIIIFTVLIFTLLFIFNSYVELIYHSIDFFPYILLIIISAAFQSLISFPNSLLQIKEKALLFTILNAGLFFLKNGAIIYSIVFLKSGSIGYLKSEMISYIVLLPIFYYFIRNDFLLIWDKFKFLSLLKFSIPFIPNVLSSWILTLSDRMFIERYFSTSDVGIYALGYQIGAVVLVFSEAFKKAYDPYFYKIANTHSQNVSKPILSETNTVFLIILSIACFSIAIFSKDVIYILFNENYHKAAVIVPFISLAYLISQNSGLLNVMIYQEKKPIVVTYIMLLGGVINVGLNFVIIPRFGILGAAYTTVFSYFIVFILSYLSAKRYFFIPYKWSIILPINIILLIIFLILSAIPFSSSLLSIATKMFILIGLALIAYFKYKNVILKIVSISA